MDLPLAVPEKGGGIDETRLEDILDCMHCCGDYRIGMLRGRMGNGCYDRYASWAFSEWNRMGKRGDEG